MSIIGVVFNAIAQIVLVALLFPLMAAWCLSFAYWIDFMTVWQMTYRMAPIASITAVFFYGWLPAFEISGKFLL